MVRTGIPLALQSVLFPVANSIVQAAVNTMGTDTIAAWGICDKLDMLIWLLADAMGPALTTYTAQNMGAGRWDRVCKGNRIGAAMSVAAVDSKPWSVFPDGPAGRPVCSRAGCGGSRTPGGCFYAANGPIFPVLCFGGKLFRRMLRNG